MNSSTKKLEKKMRILNTAFSLFRQNSVSSTAIDDIVKAAGIARGTFYLYFKDKSDLLEQVILYKSTEAMKAILKETLAGKNNKAADFIETARIFLNLYIDFLINNSDVLMIINKNLSSCIRNLPEFFDKEITAAYSDIIKQMVDFGYTEQCAHQTIFIIIDMTGSVCCDAIIHKKPFPICDIRNIIVDSAICLLKNNANLQRGDKTETLI